jgi:hypothetical protein
MFQLGTWAIAADQKPTLAETLHARECIELEVNESPTSGTHFGYTPVHCESLKSGHILHNLLRIMVPGGGVESQDAKVGGFCVRCVRQ